MSNVRPSLIKFMNGCDMYPDELLDVMSIKPGSYEFFVLNRYMLSKGYVRDNVILMSDFSKE